MDRAHDDDVLVSGTRVRTNDRLGPLSRREGVWGGPRRSGACGVITEPFAGCGIPTYFVKHDDGEVAPYHYDEFSVISSRFIVNSNVVLDQETGLEWQAKPAGPMRWDDAVAYAEKLGDGWKLPTAHQLFGLVDISLFGPASRFPGMFSDVFWSVSPYSGDSSYAWVVNLSNGYVSAANKSYHNFALCVREKQA